MSESSEIPESGLPESGQSDPVLYAEIPVGDGTDSPAARGTAAVITLNRPDQLNPIDVDSLVFLDRALDQAAASPTARTILITGAGRAFSAGGDMTKYQELQRDRQRFPQFVNDLHRIFGRLRDHRLPTVALVNGVTAAGGLELIINCDFAYVAESARIGDAHLNFGQMGGGGVLTILPKMIGRARAAELIFSGEFLNAQESVEIGLASRVVPDAELMQAGLDFSAKVAAKSPLGVANAKEIMHRNWAGGGSVELGLALERERNSFYCLTSDDAREGLAAFAAKRSPRFEGT